MLHHKHHQVHLVALGHEVIGGWSEIMIKCVYFKHFKLWYASVSTDLHGYGLWHHINWVSGDGSEPYFPKFANDFLRRYVRKIISQVPSKSSKVMKAFFQIQDCRIIFYVLFLGKVYNVTKFLEYHPGRKAQLMRGAGVDSTSIYDKVW